MPFIPKAKQILWTRHAGAKMAFYRLSEQRVMRVIHSPKRIEEGVAPKTVAMMQPASIKTAAARPAFSAYSAAVVSAMKSGKAAADRSVSGNLGSDAKKETWSQEIWVMVQDVGRQRKIISAWRYPGMTKPKGEDAMNALRREYREFLAEKK